ncbi:MAG: lipocalin-like domain-containing protein [Calditrichia bacterium]
MNLTTGIVVLLRKPVWFLNLIKKDVFWDENTNPEFGNGFLLNANGHHPSESPFAFEWWYFDVSLNDGSAATFIFHLSDLLKPNSKFGSINISLFKPGFNTKTWFIRYPVAQIKASTEKCNVKIGKNTCRNISDSIYEIKIDEADIKVDLRFISQMNAWRPGKGKIHFGKVTDYFAWLVPQPRAKVSGQIRVKDSDWDINGIGYHDHNWGTVPLINILNAWTWGRLYFEEFTMVYADLFLAQNFVPARALPFMLAKGNEIVISDFLNEHLPINRGHDFLLNPEDVDNPEGWTISWKKENHWLKLKLKTRFVLEKADLLNSHHPVIKKMIELLVAHPYYIRCFVDAEGIISVDGHPEKVISKQAICEQIVFRHSRLKNINHKFEKQDGN